MALADSAQQAGVGSVVPPAESEKARVLVVEDDPSTARLIKELLEQKMSVEVEKAPDGGSARRMIDRSTFDVVTLDFVLPDCSGLELLEELSDSEESPAVVMITAFGDERLASRAVEMGAVGYVPKDEAFAESLPSVIEGALERSSLRRAERVLARESAFTEMAMDMVDEVFLVLDRSRRIEKWNRQLEKATGLATAELFLADPAEIMTADSVALLRRACDRLTQPEPGPDGGPPLDLDLRGEGGETRYSFRLGVLKAAGGEPVGVYAVGKLSDATTPSVEVLERAVEVAEARAVGELTGEVIIRVDGDLNLTFANEEALDFWDVRRELMLDSVLADLIDPADMARTAAVIEDAMTRGRRISGLVNLVRCPRGQRYVQWNISPLLEVRNERASVQLTGRDITDQKLTEEFLRSVNNELDAFAHTVSHDLRGPLSAIMLAAETLQILRAQQGENPDDTIGEMARIISEHGELAGAMVEDLLTLAESGQTPRDIRDVDVSTVVRRVVAEQESLAECGRAPGRLLADEQMGRILANETQVYQVFANLISNAIKHNDSGEPQVEVRHLGDDESGAHRYLVRDNGPGIPPDIMGDIFKPFVKGGEHGTGLGLSIVRKIVNVYGGEIRAYNRDGACFEFYMRDCEPHGESAI